MASNTSDGVVIVETVVVEQSPIKPQGIEGKKRSGLQNIFGAPAVDAVDRMGLSVLLGFRRKMFALLIIQSTVVFLLSWVFANIPTVKNMRILYSRETLYRDAAIVMALWVISMGLLCVLGAVRKTHPHNKVMLSIFTVFISLTFAAMAGPNVHLGMSIMLLGIVLVSILSSVKIGNKVMEVFPAAFIVMIFCNIIILIWMVKFNTFIHWGYVALLFVVNTVGLLWTGYQIDRLCSRLKVDEYMLPLILIWAQLMVAMFLMMSVQALAAQATDCSGGCYVWGHTGWNCDCWVHDDGTHGKDKYRQVVGADGNTGDIEAPKQAQMVNTGKQEQTAGKQEQM